MHPYVSKISSIGFQLSTSSVGLWPAQSNNSTTAFSKPSIIQYPDTPVLIVMCFPHLVINLFINKSIFLLKNIFT
jgi:hypothetical protein